MSDRMGSSDSDLVRLGVIGLGAAGGAMIPAVLAHPKMALAGGADLNPLLRDRFARDHGCVVNGSAEELLARPDIDAAYIATPHQFHCEHAVLAADHGKHVIVEKPMALRLDDCDLMIAASRRNRTVLIVGHTHSFDPAVRIMRDLVTVGDMGSVAMIAMLNYTNFLYRPRRPEELDTSLGGGILFNQIPHQVDIARFIAGSPVRSVKAVAHILDAARPTEGSCTALLSFQSGCVASLVYSGYDRFDSDELHDWIGEGGQPKTPNHGSARRALRAFEGSERDLRTETYGYGGPANPARGSTDKSHQPHFGTLVVSCQHGDLRPSPDGVLVYDDDGARDVPAQNGRSLPGWGDVLDELYDAVRRGIAPAHDGEFGRGTVETCLAIVESSRTGSEILLARELQTGDAGSTA